MKLMKLNKQNGFTLIELMIVVLIVGILSAVAYPSYSDYVRNSKLPEGTAQLTQAKNKMEHYYQDERTYAGACNSSMIKSLLKDTDNFTYDCESDDTTFTITADGKTTQVKDFEYTVNELSEKKTLKAPTGYPIGACWIMNKSGC